MAEWREIEGFPGYEVSDEGQVRSYYKNVGGKAGTVLTTEPQAIRKQNVGATGYMYVSLALGGKRRANSVHRLVASAFLDNPDGLPVVMHLDGNKTNNVVSNLHWGSYKDNKAEFRDEAFRDYVRSAIANGLTIKDMMKETGKSYGTLSVIRAEVARCAA